MRHRCAEALFCTALIVTWIVRILGGIRRISARELMIIHRRGLICFGNVGFVCGGKFDRIAN